MSLVGLGFRYFYEWAAKGKSYEHFYQKFAENELAVYERMMNATDSAFNRERAVHVLGIERWGTHRLRVALGEPLVLDEYDGYAPSKQLSLTELARELQLIRAETVAVVRELQSKGVPLSQTVKHNEAGDLSVGGWLFYLENHIWRETMLLLQQKAKDKQPVES